MSKNNPLNPNTLSLSYADRLWQSWQDDPDSVPAAWRDWFAAQEGHAPGAPSYQISGADSDRQLADQNKVDQLVRNYRVRGHRIARLDPLSGPGDPPAELTLAYYGFGDQDLDRVFSAGTLSPGDMLPLREILRKLQATYSRFIGVQYMHIDDLRVPGMLHAALRLTDHARAGVTAIDPSAAEAADGVVAVFTAADIPGSVSVFTAAEIEASTVQHFEELIHRVGLGELDLTVADSNLVEACLEYRDDVKPAFDLTGDRPIAWAVRPGSSSRRQP